MAIIRYSKDENIRYAYLNIFPDQFKTEKEKQEEGWIKNNMDYFANQAYSQYTKARQTFVKNYDLLNGILRREDFYETEEVSSFTDTLTKDLDLPSYVKHYSIMTTPINEIIGEASKRPDGIKIKAFDDDSKSQELEFKTNLLKQYIIQQAKQKIIEDYALKGEKLNDEQLDTLTLEKVKDDIDDYTSVAEKWANHILTCARAEFNLKEKSEEALKDLLTSGREYYEIYEDNSKMGFNVEVANTKNVWILTTPDKKYSSDPSGRGQGAYAGGTVKVMELSEIIEQIPDLTLEEIDHLRSSLQDYGLINVRESNLGNPDATPGINSVMYDTYDPLVLQTRMMIEASMKENNDSLQDFLGLTSNVSSFGYKYVVVRAYFLSKKKIGKVVYIDDLGNPQSLIVDEHYIKGTIPTEISLDWGWINQWYQGIKIGPDIYHVKPFKLLDYMPLIGVQANLKNSEAKSVVDLMKPFQVLYNICLNQMYELLEKEIGNVGRVSIRRIPKVKDGDAQDDLDMWELEARKRGIMFDDDSPEQLKGPISNQTVAGNIDLTRTNEIQGRYNLAIQLKNECWELIGMSKQRLGSVSASESATGTNAALTQSYNQTEPIYLTHEYLLLQLFQAIVDASQYIQSNKEVSTVSYITSQGESAFIQVNGNELKLRDLKVFLTNRPEDKKLFEEIRTLAQPLLQNGGSFAEVIELYTTNSVRQMKKVFKVLKDKQEAMQQQQAQQEQQKIEQEQQKIAQEQLQHEQELAHEDYQNNLDRINKKEIAIIQASGFGKVETPDTDGNGYQDILESQRLVQDQNKAEKEYQVKMTELALKRKEAQEKLAIAEKQIQLDRDNQKNDLQIARLNAKNRKTAKK